MTNKLDTTVSAPKLPKPKKSKKNTQKQIWEELFELIMTGDKEKIEEAFATAEDLSFDLMKKLAPWKKVIEEITVENLGKFFSVKKLDLKVTNGKDKQTLQNLRFYTQVEELNIDRDGGRWLGTKIPRGILKMVSLKILTVDYLYRDFELPSEVAYLPKIEKITIHEIGIPEGHGNPEAIEGLKILSTLGDKFFINKLHILNFRDYHDTEWLKSLHVKELKVNSVLL